MSDDSLEDQLDKLEEAAQRGDEQPPIIRFLPIIIPIAAMLILVLGGLFFYSGDPEVEIKTVVLSPQGAMKIDPTEAGGIDIPDQDKMVYDPMKQGSGDGADTQIMPPPEAPMTPPEGGADVASVIPPPGSSETILPALPPGKIGDLELPALPGAGPLPPLPGTADPAKTAKDGEPAKDTKTAVETGKSVIVPPPEAPSKVPAPTRTTKTAGTVKSPETAAKAPKPAVLAAPTATTKVVSSTQTASLGRNYRVQIQSLKSQSQAEKAWDGWVKKHPDLLGGLSLTVQQAVIKDRGTFYRVQAGPFADHKKADDVCRKLKNRGQDCLVIRP